MSEAAVSHYLAEYDRFRDVLAASWPAQRRADALEYLKTHGFPTRRTEQWKYTDVLSHYQEKIHAGEAPGGARRCCAGGEAALLPAQLPRTGVHQRQLFHRTVAQPAPAVRRNRVRIAIGRERERRTAGALLRQRGNRARVYRPEHGICQRRCLGPYTGRHGHPGADTYHPPGRPGGRNPTVPTLTNVAPRAT